MPQSDDNKRRKRDVGHSLSVTAHTYLLRHLQVLFYSLGQLFRHPLSLLMTAAVIGIALALPTGLHIILKNAQQLSGSWDSATNISLFLKQSAPEQKAQQLRKRLQGMSEISKITYISREEALKEFQRLSGFGDALQALNENPLPSVLIVEPSQRASDPQATEALLKRLRNLPDVDIAQLDMQWVKRLHAIMDIIRRGVMVLAAMLAMAVLLVIGNTIRLAIQNRRDEIVVMKLIGGTDAFIRRPFLYTGFWYGLLGGAIAFALVFVSLSILAGPVENLSGLYHSQFTLTELDIQSTMTLLGFSILLGLAGSWLAVGKHLRDIEPR